MSAAPSDVVQGKVQGKPKPRYEGKRIALFFGAFLIVGTIIASTAAYYGHLMGNETRARFEADR